jgi:hypothetical protein
VYTITISTTLSEYGRHPTYYSAKDYIILLTVDSTELDTTCFTYDYKGANKEDYLISRNGGAFGYESGDWPLTMSIDEEIEILCPSTKLD